MQIIARNSSFTTQSTRITKTRPKQESKKQYIASKVVRESSPHLGTVSGVVSSAIPQLQLQHQTPLSLHMDFSDPVSIISKAAEFLAAGEYGTMIKLLGILDKHLMLAT